MPSYQSIPAENAAALELLNDLNGANQTRDGWNDQREVAIARSNDCRPPCRSLFHLLVPVRLPLAFVGGRPESVTSATRGEVG
jgi:hypothetical protein